MKNKASKDKLINAYKTMLTHVNGNIDRQGLQEALAQAKQVLLKSGDLIHEEVENVADYLSRDLAHALHFLQESEQGLIDWVKFDWTLIEDRLWEDFSAVADKSLIDWQKLQFRLKRGPVYNTGEMIGMGTLQCDHCGEVLYFNTVSYIPPCSSCEKTSFSRL